MNSSAETRTVAEETDIESMLNEDLDDIPDLPEFVTPKEGVYGVLVKEVDTTKEVGDKRCFEIKYKITELIEKGHTNTGDECKVGDEFSQLYFMTTPKSIDFNKSVLKGLLTPVQERFGTRNLSQTLESLKGCVVAVVVKHRKDQNDKEKVYVDVKQMSFMD